MHFLRSLSTCNIIITALVPLQPYDASLLFFVKYIFFFGCVYSSCMLNLVLPNLFPAEDEYELSHNFALSTIFVDMVLNSFFFFYCFNELLLLANFLCPLK